MLSKSWGDLPYDVNTNIPDFRSILTSTDPFYPYSPNWLDLPSDITANILHRLGPISILLNAQRVCTTWYNICKDPSMWRALHIKISGNLYHKYYVLIEMFKHAVDLSQGQLLEINIEYLCTIELLHYIADRSSKLRCLKLSCLSDTVRKELGEVLQKLPLLEELSLSLSHTFIYDEDIEVAGQYCPLLKTLKINGPACRLYSDEYAPIIFNEKPIAIAKSFPKLLHLQLIGNSMNNIGLEAILDGYPHLESLDLRRCPNIRLAGDLGIRCSQQIKCLRLPRDLIKDYKFDANVYSLCPSCEFSWQSSWNYEDYGSDDFAEDDDFTNYEGDFTKFNANVYSPCTSCGMTLYSSWNYENDDLSNHRSDDFDEYDDFANYDWDFTKFEESNNYDDFPIVEDLDDWENWNNFKILFEMTYKIKAKDENVYFQKVLSKRKKKTIHKVVSKWKTKAMLDQFYKKKKERKRGRFRKFLVDPEL